MRRILLFCDVTAFKAAFENLDFSLSLLYQYVVLGLLCLEVWEWLSIYLVYKPRKILVKWKCVTSRVSWPFIAPQFLPQDPVATHQTELTTT